MSEETQMQAAAVSGELPSRLLGDLEQEEQHTQSTQPLQEGRGERCTEVIAGDT